jgi:hypothetical protein
MTFKDLFYLAVYTMLYLHKEQTDNFVWRINHWLLLASYETHKGNVFARTWSVQYVTQMANRSNYRALNDLIKVFNSDMMVTFSTLIFVVFTNSSRPFLPRYFEYHGTRFENHLSSDVTEIKGHSETSVGVTF